MGLSEAIFCLDRPTEFFSHKETHNRELFKYSTADPDRKRKKKKREKLFDGKT